MTIRHVRNRPIWAKEGLAQSDPGRCRLRTSTTCCPPCATGPVPSDGQNLYAFALSTGRELDADVPAATLGAKRPGVIRCRPITTWDQCCATYRRQDPRTRKNGVYGICLRGQARLGAEQHGLHHDEWSTPFGGQWFDMSWKAANSKPRPWPRRDSTFFLRRSAEEIRPTRQQRQQLQRDPRALRRRQMRPIVDRRPRSRRRSSTDPKAKARWPTRWLFAARGRTAGGRQKGSKLASGLGALGPCRRVRKNGGTNAQKFIRAGASHRRNTSSSSRKKNGWATVAHRHAQEHLCDA